jgi:transcriptional regulator with XRE-family HTH domain
LADWLAPFRSFGTTFQFLISDIPGKQLADLMDVRETAISAIETGRNTIPPERYEQLAKLLNVPAQKFTVHILRYDNPWLFKMIFLANDSTLPVAVSVIWFTKVMIGSPRWCGPAVV